MNVFSQEEWDDYMDYMEQLGRVFLARNEHKPNNDDWIQLRWKCLYYRH